MYFKKRAQPNDRKKEEEEKGWANEVMNNTY